jgi:hypothetical protein
MTVITNRRLTKADVPEGYEVVREDYEVPCDHFACDTLHRHLYNANYSTGPQMVTLYNMQGDEIGSRWESRFHMAQRREWVILLNDVRVGDAHDTQQDAYAEAVRKPTI